MEVTGAAEELKAPGAAFGVPEDTVTPSVPHQGAGARMGRAPAPSMPSVQACPCSLVGPGRSEHWEVFGIWKGGLVCCPGGEDQALVGEMLSACPSEFDQRRTDTCQGREGAGHPRQAGSSGNGCVYPPATGAQVPGHLHAGKRFLAPGTLTACGRKAPGAQHQLYPA